MTDRPAYLEVLADTQDADLLVEALETDIAYKGIRDRRNQLNGEVLRRFPEGATQWIDGGVIVIKVPAYEPYQWQYDLLLKACEGKITKAQWEEMVYDEVIPEHVERRFNSRTILSVAKKAGINLEGTFFRPEREPALKYERDALLEQLEASVAAEEAKRAR